MHTRPRLTPAIAVIALILMTAGCAGASLSPSAVSPSVVGRTFLSVSARDSGVAKPLVAVTRISLAFQNGSLSASVGCNSMGGAYHLDSSRLVVDQMATTDMGCKADLMAQDAWLAAFLGSRPTVSVAGNAMTLDNGSIVLQLLDRAVAKPDVSLTLETWKVESIITGDAVSSIPNGATATLMFNADATLTIHDSCNDGGARWRTVGDRLEISEIVLTKKACVGATGELESAVLTVLRAGSLTAVIDSDSLTLSAGSNGLQLRALLT